MELECLRILKIGQKFNITKKSTKINIFFSEHMDTEDSIENILRWFYIPFFIEIFDRKCLFLNATGNFWAKMAVRHFKTWSKQRYCIINEKRRHKYEQVFDSYLPVPSPPPETSVLQMAMNKARLPISSLRSFWIVLTSVNRFSHSRK